MTTVGAAKSDSLLNDVFSGYQSAGGTTFAATATTIPITDEHFASSASFSLSAGEVTVSSSAPERYEITYGVGCLVGTSARTQAQSWLEVNGVEVGGTRCALYCRQANHGATGSAQIFLQLADGDTVRVRAVRTAGGGTLSSLANGTRLALRRL